MFTTWNLLKMPHKQFKKANSLILSALTTLLLLMLLALAVGCVSEREVVYRTVYFAETNGVPIDSGCRAGNCGTCLTAIKSGNVELLGEPGSEPEAGSCLTCISIPKDNMILDA